MTVVELLIKILENIPCDLTTEVMVDGSIPIPLEECFEIVDGKGYLLFKEIKCTETK